MCTGADNLTPAARVQVVAVLAEIAATLAREYGCEPGDVVIGPVDLGPPVQLALLPAPEPRSRSLLPVPSRDAARQVETRYAVGGVL